MKNNLLNYKDNFGVRMALIFVIGVVIFLVFTNITNILPYTGYVLYVLPIFICILMHFFMHKNRGNH